MYNKKYKKAFSLIELLIVIFIISLIYVLGFEPIFLQNSSTPQVTPLRLTSIIKKHNSKVGKMICLNQCKDCFFTNSLHQPLKKLDINFDLGKDVSIYTLDKNSELKKMDFGRIDDNKVCMVIEFYKNGSNTQFILQNSEHTYFISSFFDTSKEIDSLEEAKELWIKDSQYLQNMGDLY
jgi:prepilin-type N-terminal cleavage/methylation domain-containing protein